MLNKSLNALGGRGHSPLNMFFGQRAEEFLHKGGIAPEIQALLDKPLSWFEEDALRTATPGESLLTQVGFVLDKSSSMNTGKSVTIEGFNTQLDLVREGAKTAGETLMTLAQFSTTVELSHVCVAVDKVPALTNESYLPSGYTALFDGIGDTLAALLRQPRIDSPACATLFTIFTDGEENMSRRYSGAVLQALIQRLEATKRWTFALVGPKNGVKALADILSVARSNVTGFDPTSVDSRKGVMGMVGAASSTYMSMRSSGMTQVMGLYDGLKND